MGTLPFISILCPTYGRTGVLAELVECYRRQDYAGRSELVILNDRWSQHLVCTVPGVRVYNQDQRASSLGAKRTMLLHLAAGEAVQWWDDDDIYLPHHLSASAAKWALGEALTPEGQPPAALARLPYEYRYNGVSVELQHAGGVRGYTWRASALETLFPMTQDRGEWSRLLHRAVNLGWIHGEHHNRATCPPSIIQRVATGHARVTTHAPGDISLDADVRTLDGGEPCGEVIIEPRWTQDYLALVRNAALARGVETLARGSDDRTPT